MLFLVINNAFLKLLFNSLIEMPIHVHIHVRGNCIIMIYTQEKGSVNTVYTLNTYFPISAVLKCAE